MKRMFGLDDAMLLLVSSFRLGRQPGMVDPKIALIVEYVLLTALSAGRDRTRAVAARNSGISYCCWLFLAVMRRSGSLLFLRLCSRKASVSAAGAKPLAVFLSINSVYQLRLHQYRSGEND